MIYAERIRDFYYKNKDARNKQRKESGLAYMLKLIDYLDDGYKAYCYFCYKTGTRPKKKGSFLRSKII
jgi:hypothetical protein